MEERFSFQSLDSCIPFRHPERIALKMPDIAISFEDIDRASGRLATLMKKYGSGDVLILLPFNTLYYITILACMRAGRCAVPLDPTLPRDILNRQIARIGTGLLLTDHSMPYHELSHQHFLIVPSLSELMLPLQEPALEVDFSSEVAGESALHRLFTSGTSGQQTLVTISREAMYHDVLTTPSLYGLTDKYTLSNIGRYTSSLHINAFWRCLYEGASFLPVDLKTESSSDIISRWNSTDTLMLQGHPSLMDVIFDLNAVPAPVMSIRHLILGGEPLKGGWLKKLKNWLPAVETVSYNYSSTETMLIACRTFQFDQVDQITRIPAGFPAPGKTVLILNESGAALPIGDVGEIFVTSAFIGTTMEGVGTEFRIQSDPISGFRTWQTGDLGRWLPDGSIEHLGRADRQLKINGQRIDPVFIEQCIEKIENINRSIVFAVRDDKDAQQLMAVYEGAEHLHPSDIRQILASYLPIGFIPAGLFRVDKIPATHRGKPDLQALERIVQEQWSLTDLNRQDLMIKDEAGIGLFLQQKWTTLLPAGRCDVDRSLFDQGADSVTLLKMVSAISDRFGVRLNIGFLLQHVTLNEQTVALLEMLKESSSHDADERSNNIHAHIF